MIDELRKLEAKVRAAKVVPGGLVQMPHDFGLDDLRALQALIRQQAGGDGGRTAPDYAIEFGIYLADAVKKYMHAREDYESAVESEAEDQDACGDVMTDHWMAMQSAVYEFLKRAQRAAAAPTQPPAPGEANGVKPGTSEIANTCLDAERLLANMITKPARARLKYAAKIIEGFIHADHWKSAYMQIGNEAGCGDKLPSTTELEKRARTLASKDNGNGG